MNTLEFLRWWFLYPQILQSNDIITHHCSKWRRQSLRIKFQMKGVQLRWVEVIGKAIYDVEGLRQIWSIFRNNNLTSILQLCVTTNNGAAIVLLTNNTSNCLYEKKTDKTGNKRLGRRNLSNVYKPKTWIACKGMMDERTAWGINDWIVQGIWNFIRGS